MSAAASVALRLLRCWMDSSVTGSVLWSAGELGFGPRRSSGDGGGGDGGRKDVSRPTLIATGWVVCGPARKILVDQVNLFSFSYPGSFPSFRPSVHPRSLILPSFLLFE